MELSYGRAARCHTFLYAPDYEGWVTIGARPEQRTVGKDLKLYIQWDWKVRPTLFRAVPPEGIVLCTGMGLNNQHEIAIISNELISMGFGYGDHGFPTSQKLYDIKNPWLKVSHFEQREREGKGFWVAPKGGPLDPSAEPLKTPRTW